ncbi:MAG: hypothetical protein HY560_11965 [Gemmatimonadetes bacterium]|nr:hypothetical protein [Gemmatimonadota bacterium]
MRALFRSVSVLTLFTIPLAAQAPQRSAIAQFNPLGFLQFGPNVELLVAPTTNVVLAAGVRIPTLGLASHLVAAAEGDALGFAWTLGGSILIYPGPERFHGWFFGPRVETGNADTEAGESKLTVFAGEFGHRWIRPSGFTYSVSAAAGAIIDDYKDDSDPLFDEKETIPFGMLVVTLGIAF